MHFAFAVAQSSQAEGPEPFDITIAVALLGIRRTVSYKRLHFETFATFPSFMEVREGESGVGVRFYSEDPLYRMVLTKWSCKYHVNRQER